MPRGPRSTFVVFTGVLVWLAGNAAQSTERQTWSPDTPAGVRLKEAVGAINAGDMDSVRSFIDDTFAPKSLEFFGKDELFDVFYGMFEKYGGLDFHHVKESSPSKEVAVFSCPVTGTGYVFGLTVQAEPPHLVRGMTILPLASVSEDQGPKRSTEEAIAERLSVVLDRFEKRGVFSGVVLVSIDEQIIFHNAYGWANRESAIPATVDTKFNLASVGKMFTAVAIAQLCEKEILSYDDPIGTFLLTDWIPPDIAQKVKIKHLLTHTSGLGGEDSNIPYVEEAVARGFRSIDDYKSLTVQTTLGFEPGTKYEYSNIGYHLLGAIIERVSGESYSSYLNTHIFGQAEMTGAKLTQSEIPLAEMAVGYEKVCEGDSVVYRDNRSRIPEQATPAGLCYATANDLLQFAQALRYNTLVTAQTQDILFAPKAELNSPRYGFGFEAREIDDRRTVGHTGGYIGINDTFSMGRDDDYTVVILSNLDILTGTVCEDLGMIIGQMISGR